ncbi:acetaldehyde dehydrogenase (acetylating) [Novisyntrophococcus fermenticellae]|uniref:acetaldehyde dehydrogenase (acetylating) n=1 Tax=Novisyntrophococcus fermenticellae TaxID=2068655 RepID=UPI001E2E2E7F|nr:acetaldehyde dehydrogenase (acetylating) [Novisyntrophococcus fermenticellae]
MELKDKDLVSVQETRNLLEQAKAASKELARMDQQQIDRIVKAISEAGAAHATELAKAASEETGFGIWQDKVIKNLFAAKVVYEAIKDEKTIGILHEDRERKTWDIGVPVGVIAGIVPSTNPTSTIIYKSMIALKGGNAIVFSPHPGAKNCILDAVRFVAEAAYQAGCPKGAISAISVPTMEATQELMRSDNTSLILATGGGAMVKSAYSSGTPAIGVGAGNGPAFIDKSADVKAAVRRILDSKTFDNGTICASEQSIIVEKSMEAKVLGELNAQGAYIMDPEQTKKLGNFILRANGTMNPKIVGKSCAEIARYAGLNGVPSQTKVLVGRETKVGAGAPYSREKLAPILGLFVEENVDGVLERSIEILHAEGAGHTFSMHADDDALVRKFALQIPASRFLVNTPGALGGIGATTNLFPALTLGCGAVGGSSSSNNIGPLDLINIKRVAFGTKELADIRGESGNMSGDGCSISPELVDSIVEKIMKELAS